MELVGVYYLDPGWPESLEGDGEGMLALARALRRGGQLELEPFADDRPTGRRDGRRRPLTRLDVIRSRVSLITRLGPVLQVRATPAKLALIAGDVEWLATKVDGFWGEHLDGVGRTNPRFHPASRAIIIGRIPPRDWVWPENQEPWVHDVHQRRPEPERPASWAK